MHGAAGRARTRATTDAQCLCSVAHWRQPADPLRQLQHRAAFRLIRACRSQDVHANINTAIAGYGRTLGLFGHYTNIGIVVPYVQR